MVYTESVKLKKYDHINDEYYLDNRLRGKTVPFFVKKVAEMLNEGHSPTIAIVGPTGNGKSMTGLRIAEIFQEEFDFFKGNWEKKQLCYEVLPFIEQINSIPVPEDPDDEVNPDRKVLIFDEAGVNLNSKDWYEDFQRALDKVLQTQRIKNCLYIFVLPRIKSLEKSVREEIDFMLDMEHTGAARVGRMKHLHDRLDNKDKYVMTWETWKSRELFGYDKDVDLCLPKPPLREKYKEKEYEFKGKGIQELEDDLRADQEEEENEGISAEDLL